MLINLAEENPPGIETWGLKSTPKNFESYFAPQMFGEKRQKHTKRKLSLTQTQRHAQIPVQPLFSGVKSFLKIFGEWMCPYDFSENSHIATPWHADKSG